MFSPLKTHPLQNAAIVGQRRSGKTSLLNYLSTISTAKAADLRPGQKSDWLTDSKRYRWIFTDFQDTRLHSRAGLLQHWLRAMNFPIPADCTLEAFMDIVSNQIHQPTVVLMDEIGVGLSRCPELDDNFWESIRSWATTRANGNLGFVMATPEQPINLARHNGHSSPFFNIFGYTATLKPLTEPEARELIASAPIHFAEADIVWILHHSGGWPILLQILCRERLFALQDGDTSEIWKEDGLEQIQPFAYLLTDMP
jgi:hypothetical protein